VVIYQLCDRRDPSSWKAFRISEEGFRPTGGLDLGNGLIAFASVGERIHLLNAADLEGERVEFRSTFSYREMGIGDLKTLRILPNGLILLGGTQSTVICTERGETVRRFPWKPAAHALICEDHLILADGGTEQILIYRYSSDDIANSIPLEREISSLSLSPDGRYLFSADTSENLMGIYDLKEGAFLGFLQGYGYGAVKVLPDGTIITTRREKTEEGTLYHLERLETNLLEALYPPERQKQLLKNAEALYRRILSRTKAARKEEELENLEELQQLRKIELPLRGIRELVRKAEQEITARKWNILTERLREHLRSGTVEGKHLTELEEKLPSAGEPYKTQLQELKVQIESYLRQQLRRLMENACRAAENLGAVDPEQIGTLPEVDEVKAYISRLPVHIQEEALAEFERTLRVRLIENRMRILSVKTAEKEVSFGRETFPRFKPEPRRLRWRIRLEEGGVHGGHLYRRILFEREDGLLLEPRRYTNLISASEGLIPRFPNRFPTNLSPGSFRILKR